MAKEGRFILGLFIIVFFLSFTSASVSCNQTSITTEYDFGNEKQVSVLCDNSGNATTISTTGSYVSSSETAFSVGSKTIPITLSSSAPAGLHSGSLNFGSGESIPIAFNVNQVSQGDILIFPTSKIITVKQGSEKTQNIQISVPDSYPRTITINSIDLNPSLETISLGDLDLGQVSPGQTINIPVVFSGVDASIGSYSNTLTVFATDSEGQVDINSVSLSLQVSQGINPISNFSQTNLPSCSLSAVDIGLNQTAQLVCSRPDPNIDIIPIINNFYLTGVQTSSSNSQYVYTFKGKNLGVTNFEAQFKYQNGQIGEPFNQSIRISNTGQAVQGINLEFIFYQGNQVVDVGSLSSGETIIQTVDNNTNSVIDSTFYYGGVVLENESLFLEVDKNYELRASAPGYIDAVINFNVSENFVPVNFFPSKPEYRVGEEINITSTLDGVTYLINDNIISIPYIFKSEGIHNFKAIKQGYVTKEMNLTVLPSTYVATRNPQNPSDWKKGSKIKLNLNKDASWEVNFISESIPIKVASGTGSAIEFKPEEIGAYEIVADGVVIETHQVLDGKNFKKIGAWVGAFLLLLVVLILINRKGSKPEENVDEIFGNKDDTGMG